ncbi:1478_t:CDS:2, partial [Paraglomus occultum]
MERPSYLSSINEHNWRASVRQQNQPNLPNFFRDIMDEYEKVINDIDELRSKFYETWGKYREEVIYSDEERRLFETTQAVTRSFYERMHLYKPQKENNEDTVMHEYIHDTFKETFRDSNYEVI